jgi:hypothetical protein
MSETEDLEQRTVEFEARMDHGSIACCRQCLSLPGALSGWRDKLCELHRRCLAH